MKKMRTREVVAESTRNIRVVRLRAQRGTLGGRGVGSMQTGCHKGNQHNTQHV